MATLKELRKMMGMTQRELADKTGLNIRLIAKYESGECKPENMTTKSAEAISKAFGCTMEDILNLDLNIFTTDAKNMVKDGDLTVSEMIALNKNTQVKKLSKIGRFGDTYNANAARIPDSIWNKLSAQELADLVDAFYDAYSDGKTLDSYIKI